MRAGALLVLMAALGGLYGAASSDAFTVRRTEVSGITWTREDAVLAALAIPAGQNLFTLDTATLEASLLAIPAIRGATVTAALPDSVVVTIRERVALMAWQVGSRRFLVDGDGFLFAELGEAGPAGTELPVIDDRRSISSEIGVGSTLDRVSLDAGLRLGSLTPADLGSTATRLALRVDDADGFVIRALPADWTAVFGFYTPTLRTTELIPGQVRLLRSLLLGREGAVLRIILADDRSGTYIPRSAPPPSAKPSPSPRP